jgi:hypothetical protein
MVDWYTKAVLTVIAIALTALAVQGLITPLEAQNRAEPQKVQICDGFHCASLAARNNTIGGVDWVLPAQIDNVQKVQICDDVDVMRTCVAIDGIKKGALRVSAP